MLFLSHPWADAELENVVELDALILDFPGIIAQATVFIYLSLQDLRAALAAPSEGAAVHPQCPGVCWMYSMSWGSLLKGVEASKILSPA